MSKIKIFNQIDFSKEISNFQFLENNLINKNYAQNSILIRCFDIEQEAIIEIIFAKGKKNLKGNNSLFKLMQGYKSNDIKKNVYNVGIPINHFFWVRKYDINSGELIDKKYVNYYQVVEILELNNKFNIIQASKQKEKNKTKEELIKIRKDYEEYKNWYENEKPNEKNTKINQNFKENKYYDHDIGNVIEYNSEKQIIQNILK